MFKINDVTYSSENKLCVDGALKLSSLWSDLTPGSSSSPLSNLNDMFAANY